MKDREIRGSFTKQLVKLREVLTVRDMADILLVWNGFKPAAMIEISHYSRMSRRKFLNKVHDLERILNRLKLKYKLNLNYPRRSDEITQYSFLAKSEKIIEKLIAVNAEENLVKRRLRVGKALGYPPSAVKAFAFKKWLDPKELPTSVRRSDEFKFLNFRLSENWQKEILYLKREALIIKKMVPEAKTVT